jgi:hypothetical protein
MVQEEVLILLEECQEALSCNEICEKLIGKDNVKAITRACSQLEKYGEIQGIQLEIPLARRIFGKKAKHKLKVYCVIN